MSKKELATKGFDGVETGMPTQPETVTLMACKEHPDRPAALSAARKHWRVCAECMAQYQKAYRATNADRIAAQKKQWADINAEQIKIQKRGRYAADSTKDKARKRKFRDTRREHVREHHRAWRHANHARWVEIRRASTARYRARLSGSAIVPFTPSQLKLRLSMYGNRCWMCGDHATEVDHVIPIARGGPHILANLRPACGTCNKRKGCRPAPRKAIHRGYHVAA